ncbi:hypothetical protein [Cellulomonas sp. URHE0023]|uniref:hypothetical protein n=1 Tax=Cellulomonas sp. URHE0023 TaxID=1380354 RepID=UPI000483AC8D|nr:hypothetical protein [Cellulomonas sp. URHE0023]
MTEPGRHDQGVPPEPVVEDRRGDASPSIAQADDDVAEMVLGRAPVADAPDDPTDPPVNDGPVNSA